MAPETLSCPYCNTSVRVVRPGGAGQRLSCPRCHEQFPYSGAAAALARDDGQSFDAEPDYIGGDRLERRLPTRWSNRAVAMLILSIMATMAAIGFTFAWFTTATRRHRDHLGAMSAATLPGATAVAPAQLAAIGYLPAGMDAIAGIHVAQLMAQPETAELLRLLRSDRAEFGIYRFEQLTGLRLEDLDHLVLGLKMEDVIPHIFLIARTRRPYDPKSVRARLNASKRATELPDKSVYRIAPDRWQLGGALWCADDLTLVFSLQPSDLVSVPATPIAGVDRFPELIRTYLTRVGMGTQAWAVSASSQWEGFLGLLHLLGLQEADPHLFSRVRAFRSELLDQYGRVNVQFECKCIDAAGAEGFDNYLASKGLDSRSLNSMAAKEPRAAALLREIALSLVRKRGGDSVFVHFFLRTRTIREALAHEAARDRAVE